jgi:hypothetical protein
LLALALPLALTVYALAVVLAGLKSMIGRETRGAALADTVTEVVTSLTVRGPAARKLRYDVIVPLKRQKKSMLAVIGVFPSRFRPLGTSDSAGVIPFLTNR